MSFLNTHVQNFSFSSQQSAGRDMAISRDGLNLYVIGNSPNAIHQYVLTTAWDVSTASYTGNTIAIGGWGIAFNPSGTKMYVSNSGILREYELSTPWDVSTSTANGNTLSIADYRGVSINKAGTLLHVTGYGSDSIHEYALSTPYDISTGTFLSSISILTNVQEAQGLYIQDDMKRIYVCDAQQDKVFTFINPTPKVYVLKYDRGGFNWVLE